MRIVPPGRDSRDSAYVATLAEMHDAMTREFVGRVAIVSSFGVESAVLLALAAEIDRDAPVLFIDTGRHFEESLDYRRALAAHLGLTDVRDLRPDPAALAARDPDRTLAGRDPDACCFIRKVVPLETALSGFDAWISGRKRHQAVSRAELPPREIVDGRVKLNPLAGWTPAALAAEHRRRGLPTHPLLAFGYRSVGCQPCTRPVAPGEGERDGRWAGLPKIECGIHRRGPPHTLNA